jgi:hypothetical protein
MRDFNIILQGFGLQNVKAITYSPSNSKLEGRAIDYPEQQGETENYLHGGSQDASLMTYLGTPVFSDFRFQNNKGVEDIFLETVLLDVAQSKNIVTTAITGRDGTIKEYISDGDYVINIKGAITSQSNAFPMSDVRSILAILRKKETLNIVSDYLRLFDIYNIVVTDYKFSQVEGFQNIQFFEINAISDIPYEFIGKR